MIERAQKRGKWPYSDCTPGILIFLQLRVSSIDSWWVSCEHGAAPSAESTADILHLRAGNPLPEAFESALFRQFHSWICHVKGFLHLGAVLASLMGGEGNVGKISVTGDRVILQTVPNETKYILKNYAWGKTFYCTLFSSWSSTHLYICSKV